MKIKSFKEISHFFRKKFPSHESYYVDEYKGPAKPGGNEYTKLNNKIRQDIGSTFFH